VLAATAVTSLMGMFASLVPTERIHYEHHFCYKGSCYLSGRLMGVSRPVGRKRVLVSTVLAILLVGATGSKAEAPMFVEPPKTMVSLVPMSVKQYAQTRLISKGVGNEFKCLVDLWNRESHWNPKALNHEKVGGKNAGGIPQILGLSTRLNAYTQVDRGLDYLDGRYKGSPCKAWQFWQGHSWY
jgi:hypothetical protein